MIDMSNRPGIQYSLSVLFPIIKEIEAYKLGRNRIHVEINMPKWTWIGFGLIHIHFRRKVEHALNVYGPQTYHYSVSAN